jgi:hypothetical protein
MFGQEVGLLGIEFFEGYSVHGLSPYFLDTALSPSDTSASTLVTGILYEVVKTLYKPFALNARLSASALSK